MKIPKDEFRKIARLFEEDEEEIDYIIRTRAKEGALFIHKDGFEVI